MCYWQMDTGAITMNMSITKTSSLFVKKQRSAWHVPGESLQEGTQYGWLDGLLGKKHSILWTCLFIGQDHRNKILVMTYAMSSHCTHHLLEVWDDGFDITYWAMPIVKSINQHSLAHNYKARQLAEL